MKAETWALGSVLLIAAFGVIWSLGPQVTGNVSTLQQWPHVGTALGVDRNCQYFSVDCELVRQRPATFETFLRRWCQDSNPHSKLCMAKCAEQGFRDAQYSCPGASPYLQLLQQLAPQMATGQVAVDPLGCARLAGEYDFVLQKTLDTSGIVERGATALNPCTGVPAAAVHRVASSEQPFRTQSRTAFTTGDVQGSVNGQGDNQGDIAYTLCADGRAVVRVSGINVCNTL